MNRRMARQSAFVCLATVLGMLTAAPAGADIVVLTFEGLDNLEPVQNFYNGGTGSFGSVGPDFNITFSSNALAVIDSDAGGTGNIGGEPSPDTALFFLEGTAATLNFHDGFTGFSFFYSAINQPGFIRVFDGLNATGNLLATLDLPLTPDTGAPDPTGNFSPFVPIGVRFSGTALSVDFGGTIDKIAFDNITFGSETPEVSEPGTMALVGLGLAAIRLARRRRPSAAGLSR